MPCRVILTVSMVLLIGGTELWAQRVSKDDAPASWISRLPYPTTRGSPAGRITLLREFRAVVESEPNNDLNTADFINLGDQGTGTIDPANDVDVWLFSAQLETILDIDVDAVTLGSDLDALIGLIDSQGPTLLAVNDDSEGLDSRLKYSVTHSAIYYVAVLDARESVGGPTFTYQVNFGTAPPGPGDFVTVEVSQLAAPFSMAAGDDGDLFIAELAEDRITRLNPAGGTSTFATNIVLPQGMAFDVFGDLLVASGDGPLFRYNSFGQRSLLIDDLIQPFWVAIGPDGSIWVSDLGRGEIRRYDLRARFKESFDVSALGGAGPMTFSPAGELYFSTGPSMYKLVNGEPQLVFSLDGAIWGFAFDVDGRIYVPDAPGRKLILYESDGNVLQNPYLNGLQRPLAVAFGRDPDGSTNSRLLVSELEYGWIAEANSEGVLAPGWPVTVSLDALPLQDVVDELLGTPGLLGRSQLDMLDALGNDNARLDVGDLRALMVETGLVGGATAAVLPPGRPRDGPAGGAAMAVVGKGGGP